MKLTPEQLEAKAAECDDFGRDSSGASFEGVELSPVTCEHGVAFNEACHADDCFREDFEAKPRP